MNMKQPYLVYCLDKSRRLQLDLLIGLWLAAVIWFLFWWFEPRHFVDIFHSIFCTLIIFWGMLLPGYYFYFLRRMKKPNPDLSMPNDWRVAMVVTKAPNEPFSMVRKMLQAMLLQEYPHDTWLADEDPTPEVYDWCEERGVKISCRKGIADYNNKTWPRREKCKEGNLAYFYDKFGYERYDFISQMDADHIPESGYLRAMLQGFLDPKVGYVSAPSMNDANIESSWISRGRIFMEATLHGSLQSGYNGHWTPMCIGSHYAVRTSALKDIGGLGPELAEDHSTTFLFAAAGWNGVHSIDAIAHGEGPETFKDCMLQEFQWARSLAMIVLEMTPKHFHRLTFPLKLQFGFAQAWYFLYSGIMIMSYSLAPIALATGVPFTNMTYLSYAEHVLVPISACLLIVGFVRRQGCLRPNNVPLISWEAVFFQLARWPYVLWAVFDAVKVTSTKSYIVWRVTPKHQEKSRIRIRYIAPYIAIVGLCSAALIYQLPHIRLVGYFCLTLVTLVWYSSLIIIIQRMHRKEKEIFIEERKFTGFQLDYLSA